MNEMSIEYFGDSLRFLDGPLKMMGSAMNRYINKYQTIWKKCEVPYYFNERATLSQFAGGLWLSSESSFALEEFGKEKGEKDDPWKGRGDIWFMIDGLMCYGEAKQKWVYLPVKPKKCEDILNVLLSECNNSIRDSKEEQPNFALGIVFVVVTVKQTNGPNASDHLIQFKKDFSLRMKEFPYESLMATYFRPDLLEECRFYEGDEGYLLTRPALLTLICGKPASEYARTDTAINPSSQ